MFRFSNAGPGSSEVVDRTSLRANAKFTGR